MNRDGWGYQVKQGDYRFHYFQNGDSLCGRKAGGGYMSNTPHYPTCERCLSLTLTMTPTDSRGAKKEKCLSVMTGD
jgi:hypothetical protein